MANPSGNRGFNHFQCCTRRVGITRGKCVTDFVLPFDLLFTVTNRVRCLYLNGIARLNEIPNEGFGAGEGIRTLDPNLGKVVLYH